MKSIVKSMLESIYEKATKIARDNGAQIVNAGEFKRDFFITLEQLEAILKEFES